MVGGGVLPHQGLGLVQAGLPALHRVDEEALDLVQVGLGDGPLQKVQLGIGDEGPVHPGHQLDTLGGRVGPLVKLSRQCLYRKKGPRNPGHGPVLVIDHVHLGLGEDDTLGPLIDLPADLFHIVAVQDGHRMEPLDAQLLPQLPAQALGLHIKALFFPGIAAVYTHSSLSSVFYLILQFPS